MKRLALSLKSFIIYDLGILEKLFYWKTKKYLSKYYNKHHNVPIIQNKTLIYMLDGRGYSGGLTDIIRGILSMYEFSKDIEFDFRINFCFPYKLHDYLEPNLYNWYIPENEISYNSNHSIPLWIYCSHSNYGRSLEFENEFQKKILRNFIKTNATKQQFHIFTNSQFTQGSKYSSLFNELFKPAKELQTVLSYHKKNLGTEYISMTLRFQQLLGDFVEKESATDSTVDIIELFKQPDDLNEKNLPYYGELQLRVLLGDYKNKKISVPLDEADKSILINKCINKIIEMHTNIHPKSKILITADSETFLHEVSKLDFVYAISDKNIYVTESGNKSQNIFIKAYVDLFLLSEAEKIYLLCTGSMFRSGFAKNASFLNNKSYEEIFF